MPTLTDSYIAWCGTQAASRASGCGPNATRAEAATEGSDTATHVFEVDVVREYGTLPVAPDPQRELMTVHQNSFRDTVSRRMVASLHLRHSRAPVCSHAAHKTHPSLYPSTYWTSTIGCADMPRDSECNSLSRRSAIDTTYVCDCECHVAN